MNIASTRWALTPRILGSVEEGPAWLAVRDCMVDFLDLAQDPPPVFSAGFKRSCTLRLAAMFPAGKSGRWHSRKLLEYLCEAVPITEPHL